MGSSLLLPDFRAEDYLIQLPPCSPGSPEGSLHFPDTIKSGAEGTGAQNPRLNLRLCRPASSEDGSPSGHSLSVNSEIGKLAEARSPTRHRRHCHSVGRPGSAAESESSADGGASESHADSSSRSGSSLDNHIEGAGPAPCQGASPTCTAPPVLPPSQHRYQDVPPTPSSAGPADSSSPLPGNANSFITPPAGLLHSSAAAAAAAATWSAGSRSATSLSLQGASPQQQLEVLQVKLEAETEARRELQCRLAEQRSEAEQQRHALGQQYEVQLVALRRELQRGSPAPAGMGRLSASLAGSQQLTLSAQEAEAFGKQLADQEVLLKAYQAENELAVARIRQQAAEQQRQVAEAAQQLEELQQALALAQAERARQPPSTPSVDAARLQELLRLQGELESVREAGRQRQVQLQRQVEHLGQELQGAQQQLKAAAREGAVLRQTHAQLAESDSLVQQQARVIAQLEQQLLAHDALGGGGGFVNSPSAEQQQRQQQAEAENASLRQALQQAQAQLAQAHAQQGGDGGSHSCWGAGSMGSQGIISSQQQQQQQQQLVELQTKMARLQGALALKEEQHQRQLRALRQEHEKLRVEQGIRAASKAGAARARELEAQLALERESSARKLRLLEIRLREAEANSKRAQEAARPSGAGAGSDSAVPRMAVRPAQTPARPVGKAAAAQHDALLAATTQLQQKEQRVRRLEGELSRREAELVALQRRADVADEQANAAAEREAAALGEVAALRQAVAEVTAANEGLQAQVRQVAALQRQLAMQEREIRELQQQCERLHEAEAGLAALQRQQEEREGAAAAQQQRMQQEANAAAEEAQRAGRAAAAAEWRLKVEAAEEEAAEWRARLGRMESDLRSARAGLPWVPSAADFSALERRMVEVEGAAQRREAHWRGLAHDCAAAAAVQQAQVQQGFEAALAAKERQVEEFQRQLNGLLAAARLLHASGGGIKSGGGAS